MSSLKNSDDGTSATEWSKDNLKDEWEASASPWLEEIWQRRRKWYDNHLSPEEPITKVSPACWKLTANHRSWSRRWLVPYRHGQKWQQRLNHKPQEVQKLDHSIIPLFSETGRKERRCELLQRKQPGYPESQPGVAGAGDCPYRSTSEREDLTKTCSTLHKLNIKSQFRIQSPISASTKWISRAWGCAAWNRGL